MDNFFSNFASVIANIVGITFAFLISKVLNNEKEQKDVFSSLENELLKIKKIQQEIDIIGLSNGCFDCRKADILEKYEDTLENEEDISEKNFFIDYDCFYLDFEKIFEELKIKRISFFLKKEEEILKKIEKLSEETLLDIMNKKDLNLYFKFFSKISENSKNKIYKRILEKINEKKLKEFGHANFKREELYDFGKREIMNIILKDREAELRTKKTNFFSGIGSALFNLEKQGRLHEEIKKLGKYDYWKEMLSKESKINKLFLEMNFTSSILNKKIEELETMKEDEARLKKYLISILLFFLFGIVYPLSYVKYKDEVLDYSIFNNFFSELFSISGFFLFFLTAFIIMILWYIWKETAIKQKSEEILKRIENTKIDITESSWIVKKYYEFEEIKKVGEV